MDLRVRRGLKDDHAESRLVRDGHPSHGPRRVRAAVVRNVTWWLFWKNGYEPLRARDDNADGRIAGKELDGLAIWRDANTNGVSEPGEVRPVVEWRIVSLSWRFEFDSTDSTRSPGHRKAQSSPTARSGRRSI